jgi:uncharacterized membrane protein
MGTLWPNQRLFATCSLGFVFRATICPWHIANIHFFRATTMYDIAKLLHLISAIVWMGGMTLMLFALRPATLAVMEPQPRARLMAEVWRRFFAMVAVAVVVLFTTGTHLYTQTFKAVKAAGGAGSVPLGWNVMLVVGLVMMLMFGHIYFASLPKFKRAVAAAEWPVAGAVAAKIHTMVVANFALGWVAIIAVRLVK